MVFDQPDERSAQAQLDHVIDGLATALPAVAELLTEAEADLLAHFAFPESHRRQIRSHQPPGAAQQGDQAAHRRGGHLPQPRRRSSASWA